MTAPGRPCFITFWSGDAYYRQAAATLKARCEALGIPLLLEPVADAGAYWRNTLQKPLFIRDKLRSLRRDLVWIDADTRLHQDHDEFRRLTADLTAPTHTGDLVGIKVSVLGLACTAPALDFVEAWADACQSRLDRGEVDLDHDLMKYEVLPGFAGRLSLRLMGDPARPRDFTEGRILQIGLSGRGGADVRHVMAKNRGRQGRFDGLRLEDFAAPR